jgi:hypothetical protein
MTSLLSRLSPSITNLIRLDHLHIVSTFHQYESGAAVRRRKGLADQICLALEIHAQLEEELFYPAVRMVADNDTLRRSAPEHDEMRALVTRLRHMPMEEPAFDATLFELMRNVMHHAADEEAHLLPAAERLLPDQLAALGAAMTRRRLQLLAPRSPELVASLARSLSLGSVVAAGSTLLAGAYLLTRDNTGGSPWMRRDLKPIR